MPAKEQMSPAEPRDHQPTVLGVICWRLSQSLTKRFGSVQQIEQIDVVFFCVCVILEPIATGTLQETTTQREEKTVPRKCFAFAKFVALIR